MFITVAAFWFPKLGSTLGLILIACGFLTLADIFLVSFVALAITTGISFFSNPFLLRDRKKRGFLVYLKMQAPRFHLAGKRVAMS